MKIDTKISDILKRFLSDGGIVHGLLPDVTKIVNRLINYQEKQQTLRIFYGETYDEFGMPVDCLKYYFFLSLLHKYLNSQDIPVESTVVVADEHSVLNNLANNKSAVILSQTEKRIGMVEKIKKIYDLPFKIKRMSQIFSSPDYQNVKNNVDQAMVNEAINEQVIPHLEQTVLSNRLTEERQKKFRYSREAIAISMLFDLKIGPPREIYYDQATEIISEYLGNGSLSSIYLYQTHPLGQNFAYFLMHPEIEQFGLTPYKAGSNRMGDFRIILGQTKMQRSIDLINSSYESLNSETAHPIFDLFIITDFARKILNRDYLLPDYSVTNFRNINQLKNITKVQLEKYIYCPLELGEI